VSVAAARRTANTSRALSERAVTGLSAVKLVCVIFTFILAGTVKGVTGMGLPTVSMGILSVFMPPVAAASLLLIPSFATNIWQLVAGPNLVALIARLGSMMLGIVLGTLASTHFLTAQSAKWPTVALGATLALYALSSLLLRPLSIARGVERWLSPVMGIATGLITGATGVFVIPAVPYLQALDLRKEELIQALGLSFTVSTLALGAGLIRGGAFHLANLAGSGLAVVPSLLGMWLGTLIRGRITGPAFRRWFLICLVLLGLELLIRPLIQGAPSSN
jgi:uncharacterized protein